MSTVFTRVEPKPKRSSKGLTDLEASILASLFPGTLHGYAILKSVEQITGEKQNDGTIYRALNRLEDRELIHEIEVESSDRRRNYYEITSRGRERVQRYGRFLKRFLLKIEKKGVS